MPLDTRPAELDATGRPDPWADFRVVHLHERLRLLQRLCDGHVPVMLNLPDGSALATALWAVDGSGQRLSFSTDTDSQGLQRLVEANEAVAVAYLDSIKLQFEAAGLVLVHSGPHSALHCRLPAELYRFQRRQAYRVRGGASLEAVARFRHPGLPDMQLSLRMLDISIGGCALCLPADVPMLPAGTLLGEVQVELDVETRFTVAAVLQHVSAVGSGERVASGARIGCEWRSLLPQAERALQRWIDRAQHRQRLLGQ